MWSSIYIFFPVRPEHVKEKQTDGVYYTKQQRRNILKTSFVRYGCLKDVFCMVWMSQRHLFYVMDVSRHLSNVILGLYQMVQSTKWLHIQACRSLSWPSLCVMYLYCFNYVFVSEMGVGVVCQNLQTILSRVSRSVLTKSCWFCKDHQFNY